MAFLKVHNGMILFEVHFFLKALGRAGSKVVENVGGGWPAVFGGLVRVWSWCLGFGRHSGFGVWDRVPWKDMTVLILVALAYEFSSG